MELFRYEILQTEAGRDHAQRILDCIDRDDLLRDHSERWSADELPSAAQLFAQLVVVTDDLGADEGIHRRVKAAHAAGLPIIPVVQSTSTYDFDRAPFEELGEHNAVGLDDPDFLRSTLRRHGGLATHGSGGQVFISYARRDGTLVARGLRAELMAAGFRCFLDEHEIEAGARFQETIEHEIQRSGLVILVDSPGATASEWVAKELDFARASHVPVLAVSPSADGLPLRPPHVPWGPEAEVDDVVARAVVEARRIFASTMAFRDRVARVLRRICLLRGWTTVRDHDDWVVNQRLRVISVDQPPPPELILTFKERLASQYGMVVGGTRPYPPVTRKVHAALGKPAVCVTPLSRVASKLNERLAPKALEGRRAFLSAAMPDSTDRGSASKVLAPFVITLVQSLVELGATVVFGGHPSVTPLVHRALVDVTDDEGQGGIELHQAKVWLSTAEIPAVVDDRKVFRRVQWHGEGEDFADDLAALRSGMLEGPLDGAVFIGGKHHESRTTPPGIIDEYERFRRRHPRAPAFVLGMAGGAAGTLLEDGEPPADVLDPRVTAQLRATHDPDLAVALIVAELLEHTS